MASDYADAVLRSRKPLHAGHDRARDKRPFEWRKSLRKMARFSRGAQQVNMLRTGSRLSGVPLIFSFPGRQLIFPALLQVLKLQG